MPSIVKQQKGGRRAARVAQRGFTLVEITVVSLILGLMLIVVVTGTYLTFRDRETLKGEARSLAGFLENARAKAAQRGKPLRVEYNLKDQVYFAWQLRTAEEGEVVEQDDDSAWVAGGFFEMPSKTGGDGRRVFTCWIDHISFPDGTSSKDDSVVVEFAPRGGGHWHYVYLTNSEGDFYTIEVNPFTGAADVVQGEVKPEQPEKLR